MESLSSSENELYNSAISFEEIKTLSSFNIWYTVSNEPDFHPKNGVFKIQLD